MADPDRTPMQQVIARFGLAHDPVLERLRERLGWLGEQARTAPRRALLLVSLAWGVPLLLTAAQGTAWGPAVANPFLGDWLIWAQYVVGVAVLVGMVRLVDQRLRLHLRHFVDAPLLAPSAIVPAAAAVERALARAQSPFAAGLCALVAFAASLLSTWLVVLRDRDTWMLAETGGEPALSLAAWWCLLVSGPLFWFCCAGGCGATPPGGCCCATSPGSISGSR